MKNLVVANHKVFSLTGDGRKSDDSATEEVQKAIEALGSAVTMDVANHVLYFCTSSLTLIGYDLRNQRKTNEVPLVLPEDAEEPLLLSDDIIISIKYLPEKEAVFLATASGLLITVTVHNSADRGMSALSDAAMALIAESEDAVFNPFASSLQSDDAHEAGDVGSVEILGMIEGGLTAAEWSPDLELLVLCACTGGLLVMSKTWDVVVDTKMRGDDQANAAIVDANPYHYFQLQTNNFVTGAYRQLNATGKSKMERLQKPNAAEEKSQSDDEKEDDLGDDVEETDDATIQASQSAEAVRVFTASAQAAARAAEAAAKNGEDTDGSITWRGDGQLFAVSSYNRVSGTRTVRIWNRQGLLQSVSEPLPAQELPIGTPVSEGRSSLDPHTKAGVHAIVSWRPSGNWIASVQRTFEPGKIQGEVNRQHKVILFEKNGLKRGDFNLYRPDARVAVNSSLGCRSTLCVSQIAWSCDSELLTIAGTDAESGARVVQIWFTNNGHWYLKQTLVFPPLVSRSNESDTKVSLHAMWHPDRPHRLYVAIDSCEFHLFDLCFDHVVSPAPLSSAAVIDGQTILITHLSKAAVPPPLSSKALLCPDPIVDVAFCRTVALSNLLLKGDALAQLEGDNKGIGGKYRSTGKGTFSDIPPKPLAPLAASALSAATQCSPSAVAVSRGGTPGAAVRLDVTAPLAALTALGDVLLFTEGAVAEKAIQLTSADNSLLDQNPAHAPSHQPERYMLSSTSSSTFAKPASFAKLPIADILRKAGVLSNAKESAHFRHLQWADSTQWLALHSALANSSELGEKLKKIAEDMSPDTGALRVELQDAFSDFSIQHQPSIFGRMFAKNIGVPAHSSNCITLVESKKGKNWSILEVAEKIPKEFDTGTKQIDIIEKTPASESLSVNDILQKAFAGEDYQDEVESHIESDFNDFASDGLNESSPLQSAESQLEDESEHLIQIQFRIYVTESGQLEPFDVLVRRFPIQAAVHDPPALAGEFLSLVAGSSRESTASGRLSLLSSVAAAALDTSRAQETALNPELQTTSIADTQHGASQLSPNSLPALIAFSEPLVSRVFLVSPGRVAPNPSALFEAFNIGEKEKDEKTDLSQARDDVIAKILSDQTEWEGSLTETQKSAVVKYSRDYAAYTTSRPWLAMLLSDGRIVAADLPFYAPTAIAVSGGRLKSRRHTLDEESFADVPNPEDRLGFNSITKKNAYFSESPYAPKLLFKAALAPVDCLWFLVTQMHFTTAIVVKDTLSRLWTNNVLVAPQCLSFNVLNFEDVTSAINMGAEVSSVASTNLLSNNLLAASLPDPLLPSYLLVTVASQSHAIFTLDLRRSLAENVDPAGPVRDDPSMVRFVERGALIVSALADLQRPRVILQQPRGNLEVIYPRALGLAAIQVALSRHDYLQAFLSMRANRIDLNLLYDHDPEQFEKCIEDVVIQLSAATDRLASASSTAGTDAISLFLSTITEEDCTKTQYPYYHVMFSELPCRHLLAATVSSQSFLKSIALEHGVYMANSNADYSSYIETLRRCVKNALPDFGMDLDGGKLTSYESNENARLADTASSLGQASSWDDVSDVDRTRGFKGPHGHSSLEELAKALSQSKAKEVEVGVAPTVPTVHEDDVMLGEEAHAELTRDGTGMAVMKRESRVQRWSAAEMDIRHVYAQAVEEEDSKQVDTVKEGDLPPSKVKEPQPIANGDILSELSALNQMQSMSVKSAAINALASSKSKVNRVCSLILETLDRLDSDSLGRNYLLPALTAHLRSTPPQFSEAVSRIAKLAHSEVSISSTRPVIQRKNDSSSQNLSNPDIMEDSETGVKFASYKNPPETFMRPHPEANSADRGTKRILATTAERALKYVLILADGNEIWKAALSLYDLNLAASVAQFHGRDPKEYLPFLAELQNIASFGPQMSVTIDADDRQVLASVPVPADIGEALKCAAIDVHLGRYARALVHWGESLDKIAKIKDEDVTSKLNHKLSCIVLTIRKSIFEALKRTQLFELGVSIFCSNCQNDSDSFEFSRNILSAYAAWLESSGVSRFADAAVVYRSLGDYRSACSAYGRAGMWQAAMGLAAAPIKALMHESESKEVEENSLSMFVFDAAGLEAFARQLARTAAERKDYLAAAELHFEFLNEPEVALRHLIRGQHWNESLSLIAKHRVRFAIKMGNADSCLIRDILIPSLQEAATAKITLFQKSADRFPQAARRLRIVRRVKLLIFSGRAKSAMNAGTAAVGSGEPPRLPARIPGDDILEFIVTGVWKGVHTGFDVGGVDGIDSGASIAATSLAQYSTATGASLASLAPSIARSIRSARSAAASGMSVASQSSILSAAAVETALTGDERRLLKYQQRKQKSQNRRKVKEGDPREELELVKELRQLAPQKGVDGVAISALSSVLGLLGLETERRSLLESFATLLRVVAEAEAIPMPTLSSGSDWQKEQIAAYFNWPCSNYIDAPRDSLSTSDDESESPEQSVVLVSSAPSTFYGLPTSVGVKAALAVAKPYGPWRHIPFVSEEVKSEDSNTVCGDVMSPLAQLRTEDQRIRDLTKQALVEEAEAESKKLAVVMSSKRTQLAAASSSISATTAVSTPKN